MYDILDYVKVEACCPELVLANPMENAKKMVDMVAKSQADIILFPELSMTGYTCADLFLNDELLEKCDKAHKSIIALCDQYSSEVNDKLIVYGAPYVYNGAIYNCAFVLGSKIPNGKFQLLGIVPKKYLPNYKEFYEKRWFKGYFGENVKLDNNVLFGNKIIFNFNEVNVGIEICEDVWSVNPPSCNLSLAGANILLNLSASNELVGKADYRRNLIKHQSERTMSAYAYASSGFGESSTDIVFGGHCMIYENGTKLAESERFIINSNSIVADVDISKLKMERLKNPTFADCAATMTEKYDIIKFELTRKKLQNSDKINRPSNPTPFLPYASNKTEAYDDIINIQAMGLAKRISTLPNKKVYIGISGGSDSTLALLVTAKAFDILKLDRSNITGITMPGYGTSSKTLDNSIKLMDLMGISSKTISIKDMAARAFSDMKHIPFRDYHLVKANFQMNDNFEITSEIVDDIINNYIPSNAEDLVFENVQARIRTFLLMSHGFVIGTGDMSELALGWCTYNGDHMSMYNPNCSIPKTLVKELILHFASKSISLKDVLTDIYNTLVSPELLPLKDGEIAQSSEDKVGPYIINDYFLFHFLRNGFSNEKILALAKHDFKDNFSINQIENYFSNFLKRFFTAQFKRSCVPDGPKVGSVSLSPRGDLRMPSDVDYLSWK